MGIKSGHQYTCTSDNYENGKVNVAVLKWVCFLLY